MRDSASQSLSLETSEERQARLDRLRQNRSERSSSETAEERQANYRVVAMRKNEVSTILVYNFATNHTFRYNLRWPLFNSDTPIATTSYPKKYLIQDHSASVHFQYLIQMLKDQSYKATTIN